MSVLGSFSRLGRCLPRRYRSICAARMYRALCEQGSLTEYAPYVQCNPTYLRSASLPFLPGRIRLTGKEDFHFRTVTADQPTVHCTSGLE